MEKRKLTLFERFALRVEDLLMTRLVPKDQPGIVFKWLFKIPIFFYHIGLPLFGNFILLLTTTGRKSGKTRHTPLEYHREPGTGLAILTAGWGGNTDWRRNLQADPRVCVQMGWHKFEAVAEPLSDEEVAAWMLDALKLNPASGKLWSRWAGEPVSLAEPESILRAAKYFPSFRLRPVKQPKET
jgi:deazaflavin-dependent oxidoreductase (nitroreductase family)